MIWIRYIGKTLKQDETVQTPWSVLVMKQGETKCNNETDTFLYVSSFHFVSFCFVTSIFQIFWSVSSCFRVFSYISYSFHLLRNGNGFIKKKKMYVSSFHSISPCFVTSFEQVFWSVSSCFRVFPLYLIRFICYETEMGLWNKKKMYVLSFLFVSLCFVTSIFQIVWSVSSCFRDFPLYLIRFICYKTEMGL